MASEDPRSLSALLSQALVAFTVEFDNEFERRMGDAGYPGARLSLVVWTNLMRSVGGGGISVRDLAAQALEAEKLGCLERWRFIVFEADAPVPTAIHRLSGSERRAGWGSGRGIRANWTVRLTPRGLAASRIWPPLFDEIEQRWDARFGKREIRRLKKNLQSIVDQLDVALPHGREPTDKLPALLSQLLLAFQIEFDHESPMPLVHCANTLRVLGAEPIRAAEIPRLTGISPESSDVGWQIKPYVVVASDPAAKRGKMIWLSPRGLLVQDAYYRLIGKIESQWEQRFGHEVIDAIRESLEGLFSRIAEGLKPPPGTARAGDQAPALGRRDVGPAARQRMRDLVAQTEAFVSDPAGALPHFPSWDMNRGFGP
jgi:hypothetical protein